MQINNLFTRYSYILRLVFIIIFIILFRFFAFADGEIFLKTDTLSRTLKIPSHESDIEVDGVLDEDAWKNALVIELNYEVAPGENIPPPVRTEVFLTHNKEMLYIGFEAHDPEAEKIMANYSDRDKMYDDDWVGVILDTWNDERRAFDFICNPLGVQADAIESSNFDDSWDAIWYSDGSVHDSGFTVEMAIPFSSLRFQRDTGKQIWGFDAVRSYPREVRHHIGTFPRDRNNNCYLCQSLKIEGFEDAEPGKNIEIAPTLSFQLRQEREDETSGPFDWKTKRLEPGVTAKWGITPNMTFSGTLNPDFSQVEADAAQLDINEPFALFFAEKRPFFTEGSDFFDTQFDAVYTRTIREPLWGVKLTGKEKGNTIGAYFVQDELTNLIFPGSQGSDETSLQQSSFSSVMRYKYDIGNKYTVGAIITDREGKDYFNRVAAIDADIRITDKDQIRVTAGGSSTLYPDTVVREFDQPEGAFSDYGFDFYYFHNTSKLDWRLSIEDYGKNFRADQGFRPKVDYKKVEAASDYMWTNEKENGWWSRVIAGLYTRYHTDQSLELLKRGAGTYFDFTGAFRQFHFHAELDVAEESYNDERFQVTSVFVHNCMRPAKSLFYYFNIWLGDRIDYANTRPGDRIRLSPGMELNVGRHIRISLEHTYEQLNVEPGRLYTANISEGKFVYQFTRQLFVRAILQYRNYERNVGYYTDEDNLPDPHTSSLFAQYLFSYKLNPQTVFFLGYSDSYLGGEIDNLDVPLTQTERSLFFKLGYALTF